MEKHYSICCVSQSFLPYIGGLARYVEALGKQFVKHGHEFKVIHFKTPTIDPIDFSDGIQIIRANLTTLGDETLLKYMKFKEAILNITHGEQGDENTGYEEYMNVNRRMAENIMDAYRYKEFDVLHIHDFQTLPLGNILKEQYGLGIPILFTWHIPYTSRLPETWRDFLVRNINSYDRVIFSIEEYSKEAVRSGVERKKIRTIPPFIDQGKYGGKKQTDVRRKYAKDDEILIACVSRIDPRKGQEILIDALGIVANNYGLRNIRCVFVGNGSFSKELLKKEREERHKRLFEMVKDRGLKEFVTFTGRVDDEELYAIYRACDMTVQPSLHEGFGLTVTEAMLFEKPVIGANVGGIPAQIKNGKNGYLFERGNSAQLAEKIRLLANDASLRKKMGENGKKTVEQNFTASIAYDRYLEVYNQLLSKTKED